MITDEIVYIETRVWKLDHARGVLHHYRCRNHKNESLKGEISTLEVRITCCMYFKLLVLFFITGIVTIRINV